MNFLDFTKKTLGSNRGKSSARPVRLDGLQILAESELFNSKSQNLTCELLSITALIFCFDLPNSLLAGRFHAVILSNSQVRFRDLLSNNSDSAKI